MHRDTALVIRNILLEGVETLRSTVETHVNDFKIALDLFEEEISGLTNDSYNLQPENYGDEKQEKYPHSKVMVSELLADSDGLIALLGFDCVACNESQPMFDLIKLPCSHYYCEECLVTMIELSLEKNGSFPPRCCGQEAPMQIVEDLLQPELTRRFRQKYTEFKDTNRTYCAIRSCSNYIPATNVQGNLGRCSCGGETCVECKRPKHDGQCMVAQDELVKLARENGWQSCSNCKWLIERIEGCPHMVCRCGEAFCYLCGGPWDNGQHRCP